MKLQTTITQTKEIEITLPVFYKENVVSDNYLAVLNEQTAISLFINKAGTYTSIIHTTPEDLSGEIRRAYNNHKEWTVISEVDFLQAYDDALSAISLRPQLREDEPQSFLADLEKIGLKSNTTNRQVINKLINGEL